MRKLGQALMLSLAVVGCAASNSSENMIDSTHVLRGGCPAIVRDIGTYAKLSDNSSFVRTAVAGLGLRTEEQPLYADTLDLNCDGRVDVVTFIVESVNGQQVKRFLAYYRSDKQWIKAIDSRAAVDGIERLVIAARLSGKHGRDLITLASDEGGLTPRVYEWTSRGYQTVLVSRDYSLRMESEWGAVCLEKVRPRLSAFGWLILSRETISPSSTAGHGAACDLPQDTLTIHDGALTKVHK